MSLISSSRSLQWWPLWGLLGGFCLFAGSALAQTCAVPGKDGPGTITGVVDTYYPTIGSVGAGASNITLAAASVAGAASSIAGSSGSGAFCGCSSRLSGRLRRHALCPEPRYDHSIQLEAHWLGESNRVTRRDLVQRYFHAEFSRMSNQLERELLASYVKGGASQP